MSRQVIFQPQNYTPKLIDIALKQETPKTSRVAGYKLPNLIQILHERQKTKLPRGRPKKIKPRKFRYQNCYWCPLHKWILKTSSYLPPWKKRAQPHCRKCGHMVRTRAIRKKYNRDRLDTKRID